MITVDISCDSSELCHYLDRLNRAAEKNLAVKEKILSLFEKGGFDFYASSRVLGAFGGGQKIYLLPSPGLMAMVLEAEREAGVAPPQPVEPEDQKAALMREYVAATKTLAGIAQRIDAIGVR
ncbi:MAG: hypothetical protein FWC38_00810 [Proteobacteria bacterium]|nr:hypothetical protein [Pseudomonadota bacterium]MCL2306783.1 hypothetical protein [Pseudomonadota bacterium]